MIERLAALITRHREAGTEVMRFPPVMNRGQLEKSGYLKSFPNLLGCVCGLHGTEREINAAVSRFDAGGDWTPGSIAPPISCCRRRPATRSIRWSRAAARCRPKASSSTSRPTASGASRRATSTGCSRSGCANLFASARPGDGRFPPALDGAGAGVRRPIRPDLRIDAASDAFFGRGGQLKAISQIEQALKFELLVPLRSEASRRRA